MMFSQNHQDRATPYWRTLLKKHVVKQKIVVFLQKIKFLTDANKIKR